MIEACWSDIWEVCGLILVPVEGRVGGFIASALERCSGLPEAEESGGIAREPLECIAGVFGLGGIGGGSENPLGLGREFAGTPDGLDNPGCVRGGSGGLFSESSCGCMLDPPWLGTFEFNAFRSSTI